MESNDEIRIETPEHIEFSYELAGIGSRFVAALLDSLLQSLLLLVLLLIAALVATLFPGSKAAREALIVFCLIGSFLIVWGYYVFYETSWNGQTPGKRAAMIRVLRDDGTPVGFYDVVVRNLVRIVDFLPASYALGVVSIFATRLSKRLGDLAAGTIVVRERADEMPADLPEPGPAADLQQGLEAAVAPYVRLLDRNEIEAIRRFLERRHELDPAVRQQFAQRLVATVVQRLAFSLDPAALAEAEALLEAVERQSRRTF